MNVRTITGTALLLAIALLCQMIRLLLPVSPQVSMFGFGSVVSACMVMAGWRYGIKSALVIAWIAPVVAFMQGILPFLPFVVVVGLGNSLYVISAFLTKYKNIWIKALLSGLIKACALFSGFHILFGLFSFPASVQKVILFMMSWPQFVTGGLGVVLATMAWKRLKL